MKQQGFVFLLFCLGAIVLRFFSFFPAVINHDESTYIVIADALLNGKVYFVDVIDTKPIGVFLIYAGLMSVFGKSIFVLRLLTAIWMGATAFLLYKTHRSYGSKERSAIASGIIYLLLTSIFTFYGVSPNTECFFNLFTMLSLWLILRERGGLEYVAAGTSLGLGFITKYVVGFDGLAFALFLFIKQVQKNTSWLKFWGKAACLAIGFFAVLFGMYQYYAGLGAMDAFLFHTVEVPKAYPQEKSWFIHLKFVGDFLLRYLPISLFYFSVLINKRINRNLVLLGVLWSACVLFAILIPGNWFGHYWIQFMLPFSFIAGLFFEIPMAQIPHWMHRFFNKSLGYTVVAILVVVVMIFQKQDYYDKVDYPRQVANYIKPQLPKHEHIYTGNFAQILYHLLDKESPTKYVHHSLVWTPKHIRSLQFDVDEVTQDIKDSNPLFITQHKDWKDDRLVSWLEEAYEVEKTFMNGKIILYRRK